MSNLMARLSGNMLVLINLIALPLVLGWMGDRLRVGKLSRYVAKPTRPSTLCGMVNEYNNK